MNLLEYLGNFHPLLIHLPIGILTVFLILGLFVSRKKLFDALQIIKLMLLISALSATASSISGYILSNSDSYDFQMVSFHLCLGIVLTVFNWLIYFKIEYLLKSSLRIYRSSFAVIIISVMLTGHAGGSLTHGSDFLIPPSPKQWFVSEAVESIEISMNSTAYEATSFILEKKCFVCHGKNKQKGELRLDTREAMRKGGENGVLFAENPKESLLIKSLLLPLDDEKHMPPKEKKQLSKTEVNFLIWWIDQGADFEKTLSELQLPDSLHDILYKEEIKIADSAIPDGEVDPAGEKVLEMLRLFDVIVMPLGDNSNFVSVNFVNVLPENSSIAMENLIRIKAQLTWLNLDYQHLEPGAWQNLSQLTNLRKLSVRNSNLSDEVLLTLTAVDKLAHLNLVGTNITAAGLQNLYNFQNLEALYLFQTNVAGDEIDAIQNSFPKIQIDAGKYLVPTLKSDTTVLSQESIN